MATKIVHIDGMHCDGCEMRMEEGLSSIEGVRSATADHRAGTAEVRFVAGKEDEDAVKAKVEALGYGYEGMEDA